MADNNPNLHGRGTIDDTLHNPWNVQNNNVPRRSPERAGTFFLTSNDTPKDICDSTHWFNPGCAWYRR